MASRKRQRLVAGLTLIGLGLLLFWFQRIEGIGRSAVFFLVGGAFLAAYLAQRAYGLLVPACILLGLGTGSILEIGDPPYVLGLGLGFLAIFVISALYEKRRDWWPLIPGGILLLVGLPNGFEVVRFFQRNWPLLLVVLGVLILFGAFGRSRPVPGSRD